MIYEIRRLDSMNECFEEGKVDVRLDFEPKPGELTLPPPDTLTEEWKRPSEQPVEEAREHRVSLPR